MINNIEKLLNGNDFIELITIIIIPVLFALMYTWILFPIILYIPEDKQPIFIILLLLGVFPAISIITHIMNCYIDWLDE